MKTEKALEILKEMQKWRRDEPPYDGENPQEHRQMPYSPEEFGEAIDVAIFEIEKEMQGVKHLQKLER